VTATDTTDRPTVATISRRLEEASRELTALRELVDVALRSDDRTTVTLISMKARQPRSASDLNRARAMAARARVASVLRWARRSA
jgi:hypothetical protein